MAAKKQLPFDFVVEQLEKNPQATYAEIRAGAERRGLQIYPINYGRAKLQLGLVKRQPAGKKKAKARKVASPASPLASQPSAAAPLRRGPGRPRKQPAAGVGDITSVVERIRQSDVERQRYRRAMEKVQSILRDLG